jgi:type II secretory pathway component PulF
MLDRVYSRGRGGIVQVTELRMGTSNRLRDQLLLVALSGAVSPLSIALLLAFDPWYGPLGAAFGGFMIGVLGLIPGVVVLMLYIGGRALVRLRGRPISRVRAAPGRTARDLVDFSRELASRLDAGASLEDCLRSRPVRRRAHRIRLEAVGQAVARGFSLAGALARFPETFGPVYVRTLAAGEARGELAVTLRRLADHTDRTAWLHWRLRRSLRGPLVTTFVGFGMVLVLLLEIIPILERMYADWG